MEIVKEIYIKWHESQYPGTTMEYQRHAIDQLENSKIQSYIKKTKRGNFLKGYRVLDLSEDAAEDEEYYTDIYEKSNQNITNIKPESAEELLDRLCKEYDSNAIHNPIRPNQTIFEKKYNDTSETDSDSDIEDIIAETKSKEPMRNLSRTINNIDVNKLDSNGIRIPKKKVPKKKTHISDEAHVDHMNFANMGCDETDNESDCEMNS